MDRDQEYKEHFSPDGERIQNLMDFPPPEYRKCANDDCKDEAVENGDFCRFHSDNLPV